MVADRAAIPSPPSSAPRVLLVDPYLSREDPMERKYVELYPSLGLLQLGAQLRRERVDVAVVDLTFARDTGPAQRAIRQFDPDIVGVHTKTLTAARSLEIASLARRSGSVSVAGGPDSATRPETYLDGGFDVVVVGEGEATIVDLARRAHASRELADAPGTVVHASGVTVRGPARPFLKDLDDLPLPAWDLIDMEGYLRRWERRTGDRRAAVLTSRGCPFDCSWCSKPTFGRTYRQQSPGRVLEELRALQREYRVDYVRFCDDVFGINRAWLEELLHRMIEERLGLKFECLARVDLLKPDLLQQMRRAGLQRVYVGVESGSQKMLDLMNRGTRVAQIQRVSESLRREGIRQFWFLMLGYPGETLEDIEETLLMFRRFSPEEYSVSIALPIPGTRFYDAVKDRLTGQKRRPPQAGGRSLLYEAAYPKTLYRWTQKRFDLQSAVGQARGKISPEVLANLERAIDAVHSRVVTPLLLGRRDRPTPPSVRPGRLPVVTRRLRSDRGPSDPR